jgi:hypothetical protein
VDAQVDTIRDAGWRSNASRGTLVPVSCGEAARVMVEAFSLTSEIECAVVTTDIDGRLHSRSDDRPDGVRNDCPALRAQGGSSGLARRWVTVNSVKESTGCSAIECVSCLMIAKGV